MLTSSAAASNDAEHRFKDNFICFLLFKNFFIYKIKINPPFQTKKHRITQAKIIKLL
ncbi:hypothetical protein CLOSTMETH_03569 [[Clostridium] methylpentosum DSM 5476]|uniref:Uncharacterized protein n=1 Tax=[Clostridium] methylpentosum DSM 5476 TaxID=537013 RepID=C0EI73_9FIRM|nr:hypothetical protein CLOSTMETH_03569 [[Clostridium] methylpentosum DSM 5476]